MEAHYSGFSYYNFSLLETVKITVSALNLETF